MILSESDLRSLCQTAAKAAQEAGEYIQSRFNQYYNRSRKEAANSLAAQVVTEVDIHAQEIILNHLQDSIQKFDLGLLTEEATDNQSRLEKSYFWCIDPMDGTLPFTEGRTGYSVSIALISNEGEPNVGVVYVPDKIECYSSIRGAGVYLNGQPLRRKEVQYDNILHVYMDTSLKSQPYFESLTKQINTWAVQQEFKSVQYYDGYGAVRNALEVMQAGAGCYFKFAKKQQGGGSIWDFAATCLFFKELNLYSTDSYGGPLHLNNPNTTFMNKSGVLYTSNSELSDYLIRAAKQLE